MKIYYDAEVDALSIDFVETTVTTRELAEGVVGEFDAEGRLAGLEILDATKRLGDPNTLEYVYLEGVGQKASAERSNDFGAGGNKTEAPPRQA